MDKGIRAYTRKLFVDMNEQRRRGEFGTTKKADTVFRLTLCAKVAGDFGISMSSAGAAYQEAFKFVKNLNSELVDGLGRAPDKNNGGRRKGSTKVAAAVASLLGNMLAARAGNEGETAQAADVGPVEFIDEQYLECVAAAAGAVGPEQTAEQVPNGSDEIVEPTVYTVTRAKDGAVIATGITLQAAEELVSKAKAAKKATLVFA